MNEHDVTRLSTYLAGALDAGEARELERELEARPELAAELAALSEQDRALAAAFAPLARAVAERAAVLTVPAAPEVARAAQDGRVQPTASARSAAAPGARRPWLWLVAGLAAGVLATGTLLRWGAEPAAPGGGAPEAPAPEVAALARLEQALGPIAQVSADGALVPLATGAELEAGAVLRTPGDGKCSLVLAEGTRVRVDGATELVLAGARHIALRRGRVHVDVTPASERFRAEAGPSTGPGAGAGAASSLIEVLGTRIDVAQHLGEPGSANAGRELTELAVLEGRALFCGTLVEAGNRATALDGELVHVREAQDLLLATSWVNELIAFEPEHEKEFQERIDALLAMLGRTKMAHLYEREIRSLGDHCALPLLRYVESEESRTEAWQRRAAARILADVAAPGHLAGLAELLTDSDPEVRVSAARGIERLTGGLEADGSAADFAGEGFAELARRWKAELEKR